MVLAYKNDVISKEDKKSLIDKLKRVEGRIKGIANMVDDNRDVEDIMMQICASYESLRVVMKGLIKKHMEEGISKGLISTNNVKRDEAYEELVNSIFKYVR